MSASYGQFCPVSMAAEVVCSRWTLLVIRELLCGSTRFNDLRRGVPRMSPALLSKRLKELEQAGIVQAEPTGTPGVNDYRLTRAGEELRPLVMTLGEWGQNWVETSLSLRNLDPSLLMWDMRRRIDPRPFPAGRTVVQFQYPELDEGRQDWWLVVERGTVDLCLVDPGHEVDVLVRGSLRAMTSVWMGYTSLRGELGRGTLDVEGPPALVAAMPAWLGLSSFAPMRRATAA
jgi:DNA-binding HxlR family transcriptional regulator